MAFFNTSLADLPPPDNDAARHATNVQNSLHALIECKEDGFLPFDEYMQHILYAPGLGYYSAGCVKFGAAGDFITAPLITPLFAQTIASYIQRHLLIGDSILEVGAGNGQMAADILLSLHSAGKLPERYFILETSGDLRQRQQALLSENLGRLVFSRIEWLETLPDSPGFKGLIIGNEVIDAIPVKRFIIQNSEVYELGIGWEQGCLVWRQAAQSDMNLSNAVVKQLPTAASDYPDGYASEINLLLPAWVNGLADFLQEGQILMFDYGYERTLYYRTDRTQGTVCGYYKHFAVGDILRYPGLMDITAWVDFTALAESAQQAGLDVAGYTTQASFLVGNGLLELHNFDLKKETLTTQLSHAEQIKCLLEPGEMGENTKVMALTKSRHVVSGFSQDMRYRL